MHALRLMGSGLFDEHPKLWIVLGHMGEGLPYSMWRVDNRNAWVKAAELSGQAANRGIFLGELLDHHVGQLPHPVADRRRPGDRRRPHNVLGRLAVREHRPRRKLVRQRDHHRRRPLKIGRSNAVKLFKLGLG